MPFAAIVQRIRSFSLPIGQLTFASFMLLLAMIVMTKLNGGRQLRIPREAGYDGEVFEVGAV